MYRNQPVKVWGFFCCTIKKKIVIMHSDLNLYIHARQSIVSTIIFKQVD